MLLKLNFFNKIFKIIVFLDIDKIIKKYVKKCFKNIEFLHEMQYTKLNKRFYIDGVTYENRQQTY